MMHFSAGVVTVAVVFIALMMIPIGHDVQQAVDAIQTAIATPEAGR